MTTSQCTQKHEVCSTELYQYNHISESPAVWHHKCYPTRVNAPCFNLTWSADHILSGATDGYVNL